MAYRATLLERARARAAAEGHPTFPSDAALQQSALDATLAAMEWPGQARKYRKYASKQESRMGYPGATYSTRCTMPP